MVPGVRYLGSFSLSWKSPKQNRSSAQTDSKDKVQAAGPNSKANPGVGKSKNTTNSSGKNDSKTSTTGKSSSTKTTTSKTGTVVPRSKLEQSSKKLPQTAQDLSSREVSTRKTNQDSGLPIPAEGVSAEECCKVRGDFGNTISRIMQPGSPSLDRDQ